MQRSHMSAGERQAIAEKLLEDMSQFDQIKRARSLKTGVLERCLGEYLEARLLIYPNLNIRDFLNNQLPVLSKEESKAISGLQSEIKVYKQFVDQLLQKLQEKGS